MSISHIKSVTIPDFTGTVTVFNSLGVTVTALASAMVLPSNWNSAHAEGRTLAGNTAGQSTISGTRIDLGGGNNVTLSVNGSTIEVHAQSQSVQTQNMVSVNGSTGSIVFANSNGVSFGGNASTITASHNGLTSQSNQAVSAGNGSSAFQTLSMVDTNGVSWSTQAAGLGATVRTDYASSNHSHGDPTLALTNLSGTTASNSAGLTLSLSAAAPAAGVAVSAAGNSVSNGTVVFSNSNGISFGMNGSTITATVQPGAAAGIAAAQAGTQTATSGTIVFANSNGITFGMSGSSQITASYTVPTVTNSSWTASDANTSVTVGRLAFTNSNGLTLSLSTSNNGNHTLIGSYTVPTVTNSSWTVSDAATSGTVGRLAFTNLNGITLSLSTGAAGSHTIVGSHNALTSQSNQAFSADASSTFQTLTFQNSNGVSFSNNAGALRVTHDLQFTSNTSAITSNALNTSASRVINIVAATNNTGGGTASLSSNVSFSNANGLTFYTSAGNAVVASYNSTQFAGTGTSVTGGASITLDSNGIKFNGSSLAGVSTGFTGANVSASMTHNTAGLAISASVASQSNQSLGIYASSNTTGASSSSTYDARSLTIQGLGAVSVGWSNGSLQISAAAGAQSNQTLGIYASSNTTGASSSSTYDARSLTMQGLGGVSVGWSNGSLQLSGPPLTSLSVTGALSASSNGSTISLGVGTVTANAASNTTQASTGTMDLGNLTFQARGGISAGISGGSVVMSAPATSSLVGASGISVSTNGSTISVYQPAVSSFQNISGALNATRTLNGASVSDAVAFRMPSPGSFSFIRIPAMMSTNSTTIATSNASGNISGDIYSTWNAVVYSMGTGASSKSLMSVTSGSGGWTFRNSISITGGGTQYSVTQAFSAQAEGAGTTRTTQYSISNTNYSLTTNQIATEFSSQRFIDIPFAASLLPGAYWLVFGMSSSAATNSAGNWTNAHVRYASHYGVSQSDVVFGVMGSTNLTSGGLLGAGSFSTVGGGTTAALPISAISSNTSNIVPMFQMLRSA